MEGPSPNSEKPPVTFSLAAAFFVLAVICVLLAEYQAWGVEALPAWWFTLLPVAALVAHRTGFRIIRDSAIGVGILSLLWAMFPSLATPRVYTWDSYCRNQLKQLALGSHLHSDRHGGMLPSNRPAANGEDGLSWRVMLLPFLEQDLLFKQFDLQQPWDSPANRSLADDLQWSTYRCPAETNQNSFNTSYVAITGDDTCWPSTGPLTLSQVPDGTSHTILFTETHDSGILWPEPHDLEYDKLDWRIHGTPGNSISSSHGPFVQYFDGSRKLTRRTSVNVALADGSVLRLSPDVDSEVLKQMANRRDGQPKELP